MTYEELKDIDLVLLWAKGIARSLSVGPDLLQVIKNAEQSVQRDIRLKLMDPRK